MWASHGMSTKHGQSPATVLAKNRSLFPEPPTDEVDFDIFRDNDEAEVDPSAVDADFYKQVEVKSVRCPFDDATYAVFTNAVTPLTLADNKNECVVKFLEAFEFANSLL